MNLFWFCVGFKCRYAKPPCIVSTSNHNFTLTFPLKSAAVLCFRLTVSTEGTVLGVPGFSQEPGICRASEIGRVAFSKMEFQMF